MKIYHPLKQTSLSAISAANRSQRTDIPSDPIRVSQPFWIHVITTQVAAAHEDTAVQTLQGFLVVFPELNIWKKMKMNSAARIDKNHDMS